MVLINKENDPRVALNLLVQRKEEEEPVLSAVTISPFGIDHLFEGKSTRGLTRSPIEDWSFQIRRVESGAEKNEFFFHRGENSFGTVRVPDETDDDNADLKFFLQYTFHHKSGGKTTTKYPLTSDNMESIGIRKLDSPTVRDQENIVVDEIVLILFVAYLMTDNRDISSDSSFEILGKIFNRNPGFIKKVFKEQFDSFPTRLPTSFLYELSVFRPPHQDAFLSLVKSAKECDCICFCGPLLTEDSQGPVNGKWKQVLNRVFNTLNFLKMFGSTKEDGSKCTGDCFSKYYSQLAKGPIEIAAPALNITSFSSVPQIDNSPAGLNPAAQSINKAIEDWKTVNRGVLEHFTYQEIYSRLLCVSQVKSKDKQSYFEAIARRMVDIALIFPDFIGGKGMDKVQFICRQLDFERCFGSEAVITGDQELIDRLSEYAVNLANNRTRRIELVVRKIIESNENNEGERDNQLDWAIQEMNAIQLFIDQVEEGCQFMSMDEAKFSLKQLADGIMELSNTVHT